MAHDMNIAPAQAMRDTDDLPRLVYFKGSKSPQSSFPGCGKLGFGFSVGCITPDCHPGGGRIAGVDAGRMAGVEGVDAIDGVVYDGAGNADRPGEEVVGNAEMEAAGG